MQTLHGYTVDETQWKSKGGGGQCNIAKKGGKEYFIKRLAFPRYPDSDNFKGAFKQQKISVMIGTDAVRRLFVRFRALEQELL